MSIREQTYSLDQYLKLMKAETVRNDQECQRLSGQWNQNMVNELIYTVLTNDYMPSIILGEEIANGISRLWIIDGIQRGSSLSMFRYGNARITKSLDECMVTYQRKVLGEDGKPKRDDSGEIIWESVDYDIRNKTYDQLPEELKDKFDQYQLRTAIYQNCDMTEISKLVRRFNNHRPMNAAQRAFTYADVFARDIRGITKNRFFLDVCSLSKKARTNGCVERLAGDLAILCNYPDQYRKDSKQSFKWLNENASMHDFEYLDGLLTRLTASVEATAEIRALFNSKNVHVLVAAFKAFTELGREDSEFGKFLKWFIDGGNTTEIDGKSWETFEVSRSTRDSGVVRGKLDYLVALMNQYFDGKEKAA